MISFHVADIMRAASYRFVLGTCWLLVASDMNTRYMSNTEQLWEIQFSSSKEWNLGRNLSRKKENRLKAGIGLNCIICAEKNTCRFQIKKIEAGSTNVALSTYRLFLPLDCKESTKWPDRLLISARQFDQPTPL